MGHPLKLKSETPQLLTLQLNQLFSNAAIQQCSPLRSEPVALAPQTQLNVLM